MPASGRGPGVAGPSELHAPLLRRLRDAGRDPRPFRSGGAQAWAVAGVTLLALFVVVPLLWPALSGTVQRMSLLLSLVYLLAAAGLWMGMGGRAVVVAGLLVVGLYALSAWARLAFQVHDLFLLALLAGLVVYALAGFYLVFVLEEMVYDVHRLMHLGHRAWTFIPSITVALLAAALTVVRLVWETGPTALWITSIVATGVLGGWWVVRVFNPLHDAPVLRELHLLVAGALGASSLVDLLGLLHRAGGMVPSLVAYGALVGTWIYVTYTTLQRAHFLLRGRATEPWVALLLAASFAVLWHAQLQYRAAGVGGLHALLDQRVAYLVVGVWVALVFLVARGVWRMLVVLRDDPRVASRLRLAAGRLARLAETFADTEARFARSVIWLYARLDRVVPGTRRPPHAPWLDGWELESPEGGFRPLQTRRRP